jgi:hypothetical protein
MATHTLSVLKPSVNNLTARIFIRAAGLDYEEIDVWRKKGTPEFLAKNPADLGEAYSEPAADVRGFVASVKTPAA